MVIRPLKKKTPKIQEAMSPSESPPPEPTARMIATGAVTAKSQPIKPLDAYNGPKSERILAGAGGASVGRSIWLNISGQGQMAGRARRLSSRGWTARQAKRAVVNSGRLDAGRKRYHSVQ